MRRRRVWRSVRAIGAVMGMALAATALAAQAPPGAAAPSEPPMDAAAAKELIAHVRATYAKAPKLHSSVRYVLNSAHKGIDAGTLGMGELRVNADRAARTLSMIGRTASDFSAIADGTTLEIYNPEGAVDRPVAAARRFDEREAPGEGVSHDRQGRHRARAVDGHGTRALPRRRPRA
jgi:hypothetical protein